MNLPKRLKLPQVLKRPLGLFINPSDYRFLGDLLTRWPVGVAPATNAGQTATVAADSHNSQPQAMVAEPKHVPRPAARPRRQRLRQPEARTLRRRVDQLAPITTTPCWVITLDPEGARARTLLSALKEQRLPARTIGGVDGRGGMPALQAGERIASGTTRWRHLCELKSSEVGCYLAHLRAIRRAYESGLERVCILEDDVHLEPDFGKVLAELEQLPADVEMVRLMGLKVRKRKEVQTLTDGNYRLVRPERGWCGAQGYLINRAGMKKVLDYGSRIFEPIDKLFDHFWEYDLHVYGVEPHLLWETEHESSIKKSNVHRDRVSRWLYWLHPLGKLWRSLKRHAYLRSHAREFYPAQKPQGRPGRTARMKQ
ncbi:glycosyltransferase family 25 protein [Microbulbifer marinus]|uniref:Glycosyl transferase, family 25 n=1 Tax=Microbulbifer marinus TaxID=658218 RepID=A0A1H4A6Q8_9GAMM|nr:glycosyltransferase family 25 protein [Microbulbifer marinus]SEA31813.1 glycosyl transferase, family 25 [Microbulbifer marinus]